MAWLFSTDAHDGSDISGLRLSQIAPVMSEILFAINERQRALGEPETSWGAPYQAWKNIGTFPNSTAFSGMPLIRMGRYIAEARREIEDLATDQIGDTSDNTSIMGKRSSIINDTDWEPWGGFANLYNAAMGSGTTWQSPTILRIGDSIVYKELMKTVQLLNYFECAYDDYESVQAIGTNDTEFGSATLDPLFNLAITQLFRIGPSHEKLRATFVVDPEYRFLPYKFVGAAEDFDAGDDGYRYYWHIYSMFKFTANAETTSYDSAEVRVNFDERAFHLNPIPSEQPPAGTPPDTVINSTARLIIVPVADFSSFSWIPTATTAIGTLGLSGNRGSDYEWEGIDITSEFSLNADRVFRIDVGLGNLFGNDPEEIQAVWGMASNDIVYAWPAKRPFVTVRYKKTNWTYG